MLCPLSIELWIVSQKKSIESSTTHFSNPICLTVYLCGAVRLSLEYQAYGLYKNNAWEWCLVTEKLFKINTRPVLEQDLMIIKFLAVASICLSTLNHCFRATKFYQCITSTRTIVSWKHSKSLSSGSHGPSMINTIYLSESQLCYYQAFHPQTSPTEQRVFGTPLPQNWNLMTSLRKWVL